MADVKKIATRESYGNALAACGEKYPNLVVLDADLQALQRQVSFRRHFHRHIDCGIAECNMTGALQQDWLPAARFLLSVPLPCLRQAGILSR